MKTFDIYLRNCDTYAERDAFFKILELMGLSEDTERITGIVIPDQKD